MGGTSLWLKPQMAWPSAQHSTAGFKGYHPSTTKSGAYNCLHPAWTKTKIKRIDNACEKAKHRLNPSSDKPKNPPFATLPYGSKTAPLKPFKNTKRQRNSGTKDAAQPSLDKHENQARRPCMRESQTPPKSEPRQAQKRCFPAIRVQNGLFETVKKHTKRQRTQPRDKKRGGT